LEPARKALAFGKRRIEAQRLGALRRPSRLHLGEIGSRDLVEGQVELARDVRDVPERSPSSSDTRSLKRRCASPSRRCFLYSLRSWPVSPARPSMGTIRERTSSVPSRAG